MDERIIKYFDDQLSFEEKQIFDAELNASKELQEQFNSYKEFYIKIKSLKNIETEPQYFANVLPLFRNKLEKKQLKVWLPRYSFAAAIVLIIFTLFMLLKDNGNGQLTIESLADELNEDEIEALLENYNANELSESAAENDSIENLFYSGLQTDNSDFENYITSNNVSDLLNTLNEEDVDAIYNSIINKKYF